jgi:hypothetical protein
MEMPIVMSNYIFLSRRRRERDKTLALTQLHVLFTLRGIVVGMKNSSFFPHSLINGDVEL